MKGFFVTGTDTGVGKTCISAGLLVALARAGWRTAGVKPVAAGLGADDAQQLPDGSWLSNDVAALQAASSVHLLAAQAGPVQLSAACAPHIAAGLQQVVLSRQACVAQVQAVAALADLVVVEGAGGFCVPMSALSDPNPNLWGLDDIAADLQLPVILVVALRLGCLNHALLTAQAVAARGLQLAGWVGNRTGPAMPYEAQNIATLVQWLPAPCLGLVGWLAPPASPTPQAVADALYIPRLLQALQQQEQQQQPSQQQLHES